MAFAEGNRFWEARSSHGPKPKFNSKEDLWEACREYFAWVEDNPLYETKAFHFQGQVITDEIPKMRAMTIAGMCTFLDIDLTTWAAWRKTEHDSSLVIARAEMIIKDQKFTGAAADLLNANIISRDLGLADKTDHSSTDGSMSPAKGFNDFYNDNEKE